MVDVTFFDDPDRFLAEAGDFLAVDPVLNSVTASVTERLAGRWAAGAPLPEHPCWWFVVRDAAGGIETAGMRTAPFEPHPMFVAPMSEVAARAVATALHRRGEHPGGVNGALPAAMVIAEECARLFGGSVRADQETRLWECRSVALGPESGAVLRLAGPADAGLCLEWFNAFGREADEQSGRPVGTHTEVHDREDIEQRIAAGTVWLLEDASGDVVHLTGVSVPAYGVSRIGPVYTPKAHRGRGHASHVVGVLTQRGLDAGTRMCLYTDRSNPTSNKIYEALGYRAVVDQANVRIRP